MTSDFVPRLPEHFMRNTKNHSIEQSGQRFRTWVSVQKKYLPDPERRAWENAKVGIFWDWVRDFTKSDEDCHQTVEKIRKMGKITHTPLKTFWKISEIQSSYKIINNREYSEYCRKVLGCHRSEKTAQMPSSGDSPRKSPVEFPTLFLYLLFFLPGILQVNNLAWLNYHRSRPDIKTSFTEDNPISFIFLVLP